MAVSNDLVLKQEANIPVKSNSIEQVRYACSIGAMCSASAIPRVIPIAHCGPGCANKQYRSLSLGNGHQGAGYGGGVSVPSSNMTEKEVIFGGVDRLSELIESSLKIMDADLFVVATGCIPDLVGDDVPNVVHKFQKQGAPIVYAETGGFKGNNFTGHEQITCAIIDQFVGNYAGERLKGLVNVWSLLPYQNTYWRGDLAEIKRILEGAGLRVNILFGTESEGVPEWKSIPEAQFNLVLSPWLGMRTAMHLEEKYGQPFLHVPALPVGARLVADFLRQVVAFAEIDVKPAEDFIAREEKRYYRYLSDFADFFSEYRWGLPAKFVVIGDSTYNLAITKFLVNQLGLIPALQIITDNPPEEFRSKIQDQYRHLSGNVSAGVEFEEDSYHIHRRLRETQFGQRPPLILGSTWECDLAQEMKAPLVEIGFPCAQEVVLARSYVGYIGALALLETIYTTTVRNRASLATR